MPKWVEEAARDQALKLAEGIALPVAARSRTVEEMRAKGCLLGAIMTLLTLAALLVFALLLLGAAAEAGERRTVAVVAALAFAALAAWLLAGGWRARRAGYDDPMLVVEAGAEGVTISGPTGSRVVGYAALRATIETMSVKRSVRFLGVRIEAPTGTIALGDGLFMNGRIVAAAVVRGMERAKGGG